MHTYIHTYIHLPIHTCAYVHILYVYIYIYIYSKHNITIYIYICIDSSLEAVSGCRRRMDPSARGQSANRESADLSHVCLQAFTHFSVRVRKPVSPQTLTHFSVRVRKTRVRKLKISELSVTIITRLLVL